MLVEVERVFFDFIGNVDWTKGVILSVVWVLDAVKGNLEFLCNRLDKVPNSTDILTVPVKVYEALPILSTAFS